MQIAVKLSVNYYLYTRAIFQHFEAFSALRWIGLDWIEQGLTSHQTHYRSFQGRVFMDQMTQPTVLKH